MLSLNETILLFVFPWKCSCRKVDPSRPVGRQTELWVSQYFPVLCLQWVLRVGASGFYLSQQPSLQLQGGAVWFFYMNDDWKAAFLLNALMLASPTDLRAFPAMFHHFPRKGWFANQNSIFFLGSAQTGVSCEACVVNKNKIITGESRLLHQAHLSVFSSSVPQLSFYAKCMTYLNWIP